MFSAYIKPAALYSVLGTFKTGVIQLYCKELIKEVLGYSV